MAVDPSLPPALPPGLVAFVDAESWRASYTDDDGTSTTNSSSTTTTNTTTKTKRGILAFLRPTPPPLRCPALPLPIPPPPPSRLRHWRQFFTHYQTNTHRSLTRSSIHTLLTHRLRPISTTLPPSLPAPHPPSITGLEEGRTGTSVADPPSVLQFDSMGALLAVGTTHGVVRIFDFDEFLSVIATRPARPPSLPPLPPTADLHNMPQQHQQQLLQEQQYQQQQQQHPALLTLEPRKAVSAVQWNPEQDTHLAVAFWHWPEVYLYDLSSFSSLPSSTFKVGHRVKGAAGGNHSLVFFSSGGGREGARTRTTLIAGSAYGVLRGWGVGSPASVCWEVKTRGNGALSALCVCGSFVVGAGGGGGREGGGGGGGDVLYVWDVGHLQTPILGAIPAPPLVVRVEVGGYVRGLGCPSSLPSSPFLGSSFASSSYTASSSASSSLPSSSSSSSSSSPLIPKALDAVVCVTEAGNVFRVGERARREGGREGGLFVGRCDAAWVGRLHGREVCVTHEVGTNETAVYGCEEGEGGREGGGEGGWLGMEGSRRRRRGDAVVTFKEEVLEEEEGGEEGREGGEEGRRFDLTLPGVVVWAEEGGHRVQSSCAILHHYLCPCPLKDKKEEEDEEREKRWGTVGVGGIGGGRGLEGRQRRGRRASVVKVEGRVYTIKDLWPTGHYKEKEKEAGKEGGREGGTVIELVEAFHRDISPSTKTKPGEGVLLLAPLRPIFTPPSSSSPSSSSSSSSSRRWAPLIGTLPVASPLGCLTINPATQHVVMGFAGGGHEILGSEHYAGGAGEEEERDEVEAVVEIEEEGEVEVGGEEGGNEIA